MLSHGSQSDIAAMLRRKSQLQGDPVKPQANRVTLERARLTQERTLALRRNDKAEAAMLDARLTELAVESPSVQSEPTEGSSALLAKVNERNRKANQEAIRRAELQEAERKRRERRLGTPTALDPSARLRTVPRMFASRYEYPSVDIFHSTARLIKTCFTFRSTTPNPGGSPSPEASLTKTPRTTSEHSPSKAGAGKGDFHARVLDSIEIDLGDF
jgi:RNA polymerase-associated protein RTF1